MIMNDGRSKRVSRKPNPQEIAAFKQKIMSLTPDEARLVAKFMDEVLKQRRKR